MHTVITVGCNRSTRGVGPQAAILLETLPGISEIRVEREDSFRATISYRWKDTGVHSAGIEAALKAQGMRLV